ncbi:hypothetical protein [Vulcanisaeta souniana]|nr:hypothetical protein [Vulcanisaeta souniana]GGI69483.1 hypothetical protein GCM10007112_03090 [Vulcanisaeta souniana JCM 11219]
MDEVLIGFIGVVITVVVSAVSTAYWLGSRFRGIEDRLNELRKGLSGVESELSGIKVELGNVKARLEKVEDGISRLRRSLLDFTTTIRNSQEFMIEMLSYEGVLRPEAASVIRGELNRLFESLASRISGNPLTKAEFEEIRRYIQKDELTLEEAYRFKELAWKLVREYRYRFPDVWKIYWYAVAWIGWATRLEKERSAGDGGQGR